MVYAIVKAGGHQEKVSVGDVVVMDHQDGQVGDQVSLSPVMLCDGDTLTTDPKVLADKSVSGEIVGHTLGKKIRILKFKNKTGYRRRMGHRAQLTEVKITGIA